MHLDQLDKKILAALQKDGRASVERVAEEVGLSPTPTRRRIRRLEQACVITGYSAVVDPVACGLDLSLYVFVKLESRHRSNIDNFEDAIHAMPEVVSCHLITGAHDYLLVMHLAGINDYNRYLREVIADIPGIIGIETSVVIGEVKNNKVLAL